MSQYSKVPTVADDPVFKSKEDHDADPNPDKIFLSIGAYRDENCKPYLLHVVKKAEEIYQKQLLEGKENKEYDTIDGFKGFRDESVKLLMGPDCPPLNQVASAVSISGSGALRLAAAFLRFILPANTPVYNSDPTWGNHHAIFEQSGFTVLKKYRYYSPKTNALDIAGMTEDLRNAQDGSIVVLHICGHNPTGVDPSHEQWQQLSDLCKEKQFRIMFDSAYQGYASGDLDRDAFAARLFWRNGLEFICCQSFAKNMGLYGDRLGCVSFMLKDKDTATRVQGLLKAKIIRPMYSSPPRRPSRVAHIILSTPALKKEWEEELKKMSGRIIRMRKLLFDELVRLKTPGKWNHIVDQIGMFSYLGISPQVCDRLIKEYHIYLLTSGRISMAGLTEENTPRLAKAMDHIIRTTKAKL
jgi:aspartate/tyrosine/aromatic aminotransferase